MSTENDLWEMNWNFVQSINDLTEEIIMLKKMENNRNLKQQELLEEMEDLKKKYFEHLLYYHCINHSHLIEVYR